MSGREAVIATRSAGKVRELRPLFAELGVHAMTLDDAGIAPDEREEALEAADTFEGNALAKARWFAARLPGWPVFADDSGLEVDALGGAPGVRSKRWSGRDDLDGAALDAVNNALLLQRLEGAGRGGGTGRTARYVCAAACVWPGGERVLRRTAEGRILREPQGTGGFGYDPYFLSVELERTFAEVTREAKAQVSHRGRAFRALLAEVAGAVWGAGAR